MNRVAKKILLIEDEPIAKSLYQNRLQSEGFDVSVAADGEGAMNELSHARADLVVLDLMLPKMNGEEAIKTIRSNEGLKKAPVLVISNAYMTEMSQKAIEFGATRGLLKTECTPARLVETVRDLLGFRSAFDISNAPVTDDKSIQEFADAAEKALDDELKLKKTREEFIKKAPGDISKIREHCRAYVKATAAGNASEPLGLLFHQVRFFATRAGLSGCTQIALVANAFEALLFDVLFKPSRATPSISQTFAQAVDCLERLCQAKDGGVRETVPRAKILVVDDDAVCNLAMVAALKRAHFEPVAVEDPTKVTSIARATQFDIVLLDINMPGVNGFELCKEFRTLPQYRETPVIFITANADFQNRAQSILSGGNDLIPKPVSPLELVLKVTMRLLQPQTASDAGTGAPRPAAQNTPVPIPAPQKAANLPRATSVAPQANANSLEIKPVDVKPTETKPPAMVEVIPPAPTNEGSGFSTEMIKKAWSSEGNNSPGPTAKPSETVKPAPVSQNEAGKVSAKTDAGTAEMKLDDQAISIGPLKMADEDKPKHTNGVHKPEELEKKPSKIELVPPAKVPELPKVEISIPQPAPANVPAEPVAPASAATESLPPVVSMPAEPRAVSNELATAPLVAASPVESPIAASNLIEEIPAESQALKTPASESQPVETPVATMPKEPIALAMTATEAPKVEVPAIPVPAPVQSDQPEPKPQIQTAPAISKVDEPKPVEAKPRPEKPPLSPSPKTQHTKATMETTKKPTLDDAARGVARIIFGDDNISDMNVRLTRIALERYNVPGTQKIDDVARGVSQIIFGDDKVSDMNIRLTRIALESYNVADLLHLNGTNGAHTNGASA